MRVVQRTPNLGLRIKLQAQAEAREPVPLPAPDPDPDPEPVCAVSNVAWGDVPALYGGTFRHAAMQPLGGAKVVRIDLASAGGTAPYKYTMVAIPLGTAIGGVTWTFSWAAGVVPSVPVVIYPVGPMLFVEIPIQTPGTDVIVSELIVDAFCGGVSVGRLRLLVTENYGY